MRALLVAAAPMTGSAALVARLAAESDYLIAIDGGGTVCLDAGVRPDVVLGDFDSLAASALTQLEVLGARIVTFPRSKDATDFELAIDEARRAGATEIVVTCATSQRLDHTLAVLGALARAADLNPAIAEPSGAAWILSSRGRREVRFLGVGATVSLIALGASAVVSAVGVEWPLDNTTLPPGSGLGVSNVIRSDEGAVVSVDEGVLFVLAPVIADAPVARGA